MTPTITRVLRRLKQLLPDMFIIATLLTVIAVVYVMMLYAKGAVGSARIGAMVIAYAVVIGGLALMDRISAAVDKD